MKRKSNQMTITSFGAARLKVKNQSAVRIPLYFVLDGSNFQSTFTNSAVWEVKTEAKCHKVHKFQVGGKKIGGLPLLTMVFLEPSPSSDTEVKLTSPYKLPCTSNLSLVPFLKSHLQKCIRRGEEQLALQTVATLIDLDIIELLRRLPIILIEDTMLMEEMVTLVWLMIVYSIPWDELPAFFTSVSESDGDTAIRPIAPMVRCWLEGLVSRMVRCKWVDVVGKVSKDNDDNYPSNAQIASLEHLKLADDTPSIMIKMSDLLYAIKVRKYYGGTAGDMLMLQSAINIWYDRSVKNSSSRSLTEMIVELKERYAAPETVETDKSLLPKDSILEVKVGGSSQRFELDAVDFHWSPIHKMLATSIEKSSALSADVWHEILWECASSLTEKLNVGIRREWHNHEARVEIYNKHKTMIRSLQKQLLLALLIPSIA